MLRLRLSLPSKLLLRLIGEQQTTKTTHSSIQYDVYQAFNQILLYFSWFYAFTTQWIRAPEPSDSTILLLRASTTMSTFLVQRTKTLANHFLCCRKVQILIFSWVALHFIHVLDEAENQTGVWTGWDRGIVHEIGANWLLQSTED